MAGGEGGHRYRVQNVPPPRSHGPGPLDLVADAVAEPADHVLVQRRQGRERVTGPDCAGGGAQLVSLQYVRAELQPELVRLVLLLLGEGVELAELGDLLLRGDIRLEEVHPVRRELHSRHVAASQKSKNTVSWSPCRWMSKTRSAPSWRAIRVGRRSAGTAVSTGSAAFAGASSTKYSRVCACLSSPRENSVTLTCGAWPAGAASTALNAPSGSVLVRANWSPAHSSSMSSG